MFSNVISLAATRNMSFHVFSKRNQKPHNGHNNAYGALLSGMKTSFVTFPWKQSMPNT